MESFEDGGGPLGLLSPLVVAAIAACTGLECVELRGRHQPRYKNGAMACNVLDVIAAIPCLSAMPHLSRLVISPVDDAVFELTSPTVPRGDAANQQEQQEQRPTCGEIRPRRWRRLALLDYPGHAFIGYTEPDDFGRLTWLRPVIDTAEEVDIQSRQWSGLEIRSLDYGVRRLREAAELLGRRALPMQLTLSAEDYDSALPDGLVDAILPLSYCIRGLTLRGWCISKARLERLLSGLPQLTQLSFDCTWMAEAVVVSLPSLLPYSLTRLNLGLAPRYTTSETRWRISHYGAPDPEGYLLQPPNMCYLSDDVPGQGQWPASELIEGLPLQRSQLISLAKGLGRAVGDDSGCSHPGSSNSSGTPSSPPGFTLGLSPLLLDALSEEDLAAISESRAAAGRAQLMWLELEDDRGAPFDHYFS